jgi:hypothetical protein
VVASGGFQQGKDLPAGLSGRLPPRGAVVHSKDYKNPESLPGPASGAVRVRLGRVVALYDHSSTSYHIF